MLRSIVRIRRINPDDYTIDCLFDQDEKMRRIDIGGLLSRFANTPLAQRLRNVEDFKQVTLDPFGALAWKNGVDFCPDVLYAHSFEIDEPDSTDDSTRRAPSNYLSDGKKVKKDRSS